MDKLPSRLKLSRVGIDIQSIFCANCGVGVESVAHLLFSCSLARDVLVKVRRWWGISSLDFQSYEEWLLWFTNLRLSGLLDLPLGGYLFTWAHKMAMNMSKLDRFLISEGLLTIFPYLSATCLDRCLSDHRPILMKEVFVDCGAIPFRLFHSWFRMNGFDKTAEETWKNMIITHSNGIIRLKKDAIAKTKYSMNHMKYLNELNYLEAMEAAQKAKVRWSIEGDENTKYFHSILNNKRSKLSIRGVLVDGEWVVDPVNFPTVLSMDQVEELEREVTYKKDKKAVWDCGENKSPSLDGYTFEFFRRFKTRRSIIPVPIHFSYGELTYILQSCYAGDWNESNLSTIVYVLKCFFLTLGLKINMHKSKLMGIVVDMGDVARAANIVGCSNSSMPFSYLGVKVGDCTSRIQSWDGVIRKISSRLSRWKLKTLLIGGRLTLLKSVLGSIPLYYMSLFKDKVMILKQKGGLGVSSYFALNRALLFKWLWHFISKDDSCGRGAFKHFMVFGDLWMGLGGRHLVGIGVDTLFWEDVWMRELPLKCQYPRLYAVAVKQISIADKFRFASIDSSFRRVPRGGVEVEQYEELGSRIALVQFAQMNDRWSWSPIGDGEFSVKSVRNLVEDSLLSSNLCHTRWVKEVPIKINIFAWRVQMDKLPSRLNMSRVGIDIQSILCPNCGVGVESVAHLLFSCSLARDVLVKVRRCEECVRGYILRDVVEDLELSESTDIWFKYS
ncbi:RNA-directed DNA polymerase, eukaryota, reverse transcriptase zinc-binding domain protein [Tanacetum coccineum]